MKENDYLPPQCTVLGIEHVQFICASVLMTLGVASEDFEVDLVEF